MGVFSRISGGLSRSRDKFKERMNILLDRGPDLDEGFWDELEETLILSDVGPAAAMQICENLRDRATRLALPDAYAVLDYLSDEIEGQFALDENNILGREPAVILFVGINGTGKTTTVGKLAKEAKDAGRNVILGSADTFRAAAIEQLEVWAARAGVEVVERERGADPASVAFSTLERAEATGADLVLIDTAGRLHTSDDLMRELKKVVDVTRRRAQLPVYTVLVLDATTGQNGIVQAREFDRALNLDAIIVTKLDGTAKGGIALAISHELGLPILKVGVGEQIDDLRDFNAHDFTRALIGDFEEAEVAPERSDFGEGGDTVSGLSEGTSGVPSEATQPSSIPDVPSESQAESSHLPQNGDSVAPPCEDGEDLGADSDEDEYFSGAQAEENYTSPDAVNGSAEQTAEEEPPKKKHFWQKWFD